MEFPDPLVEGRLVTRYKRFLADVVLADGDAVTAHVANPGAMTGLAEPGAQVWLSPARNPARKLRWSWELVRVGAGLVGVNTAWPNTLAAEAILAGLVPELAGYPHLRREVRYGHNSRIDLLLSGASDKECYVEIKNVHLKRSHGAEFPDAVTKRGAKHMMELARMADAGHRAVVFYLVQRADCADFRIADDIDPAYARAFAQARAAGVEALVYDCRLSTQEIRVNQRLPITEGIG